MPKKLNLPSSKRHVLLFDEDWEYLEARFGPSGIRPVGISRVIRAIIHQKVQALKVAEISLRDTSPRVSGGTHITPAEPSP